MNIPDVLIFLIVYAVMLATLELVNRWRNRGR